MSSTRLNSPSQIRAGALLTAFLTLSYFLLWWNAYAAPTGIGELVFMSPALGDFLPYRDFYYTAPPGNFLFYRLIDWGFGGALWVSYLLGICLRVTSAVLLYRVLAIHVRAPVSAMAVVFGVIVSSGDLAETASFYTQLVLALSVCGFSVCYLSILGILPNSVWVLMLGGALTAGAVVTKQTALLTVLGSAVGLCLVAYREGIALRRVGAMFAWACVGGVFILICVAMWLHANGIFFACIDALTRATGAKGGLITSLLRPIGMLGVLPVQAKATVGAIVLLVAVTVYVWKPSRSVLWVAATIAPFGLSFLWFYQVAEMGLRVPGLTVTAFGLWGTLGGAVLCLVQRNDDRFARWAGIMIFAFSCAYSVSVSWALYEMVAYPAVPVICAFLFGRLLHGGRSMAAQAIFASIVAVVSFTTMQRKHDSPYGWGGWREPSVTSPAVPVPFSGLNGIRVSEPAASFLTQAVEVVQAISTAEDRIFVYPNLPIIYGLSGRRPTTYSLSHWMDITPDSVAKADAQLILDRPPTVMVLRHEPDVIVTHNERLFRGDVRSGIRDVKASIATIIDRYDLVWSFESPSTATIEVYKLAR